MLGLSEQGCAIKGRDETKGIGEWESVVSEDGALITRHVYSRRELPQREGSIADSEESG